MTTAIAAPPLYMIRAELDLNAFHRWAGSRGIFGGHVFDEGFAMHKLLRESFGELAPQPFRIIAPRGCTRGSLYGYAEADADALRDESAACACPLQAKILPASRIDSKRMPAEWDVGRRLGFEILTRPVTRAARDSGGKMQEWDAFIAALPQCKDDRTAPAREDVYADWLAARLERGGARLEEARLASFRRTRAVRRLGRAASEGPHAVMRGTLAIEDAALFGGMLAGGVGRHKAYGYGMLLLRPAR